MGRRFRKCRHRGSSSSHSSMWCRCGCKHCHNIRRDRSRISKGGPPGGSPKRRSFRRWRCQGRRFIRYACSKSHRPGRQHCGRPGSAIACSLAGPTGKLQQRTGLCSAGPRQGVNLPDTRLESSLVTALTSSMPIDKVKLAISQHCMSVNLAMLQYATT